jgi:hypothetical protein
MPYADFLEMSFGHMVAAAFAGDIEKGHYPKQANVDVTFF